MNKDVESGLVVLFAGLMGIIVSFIEYDLHAKGVLLDEFTTNTVTISNLMGFTIVAFLMIGVLMAGLWRK